MKYCDFNGCPNKIDRGKYCEDHAGAKKKRHNNSIYHNTNKSFYNSKEWKSVRSRVYEKERGCCQRCGRFVYGKQAQVHHIVTIKQDSSLKLDEDNLKLLCPKCHMIEENLEEKEKVFKKYFSNAPRSK